VHLNPSFLNTAGPRFTGHKLVAAAALGASVLLVAMPHASAQSSPQAGTTQGTGSALTVGHPAVTGMVRDAAGAPQIGALVELLGSNLGVVASTFTDDHGRYTLPRVTPGTYEVKASGSFFLPTLRENLRLLADSRLVVNLTLNTLYQAFQWLPTQPRPADEPKDDWNWTLRLSTNRPLLRVLEDDNGAGPMVLVSDGSNDNPGRRVTVRSGSNRFGDGGMHQDVEIERGHDDAHQLILRTDLGQTDNATLRTTAAYLRQLGPGAAMITVASFADRPDVISSRGSGLEVLTARSAMTMAFGPGLEAEVGNELQAVRLGETLTATHPFASLTLHQGGTTYRYRVASSPDAEQASELDRDATLAPRVTERDGSLSFEQGLHQALEVEHQFGGQHSTHWTTGMTYFHDVVEHPRVGGGVAIVDGRPALTAGDQANGDVLYDPATQLVAVSGEGYAADGLLAFARDQLNPDTWISLRYAVGQALAMDEGGMQSLADGVRSMRPHTSSMLAASVGSKAHRSGTEWRASYRWQPSDTLTQVAPFDSSAPEAYLSFHMRQPIYMHYMGLHGMQAIVDVRNLLAQGYRPFLSQDGSTLYFAQAERCVEGGVSFSF
jgi:hypothetical protein